MDRVTYEIEIDSDKDDALYTVQASLCSYAETDPETGCATPRREWVEIESVDAEFFQDGEFIRREDLTGAALVAFREEYAAEVEDKLRGKMESAWEDYAERTGACG